MKNHLKAVIFILLTTLASSFYFPYQSHAQEEPEFIYTHDLDPQLAVDWMETLYDAVERETVSAPGASRIYAYAGVTLYEALLYGIPGNNSLSWQLNDLPDLPYPPTQQVYDWATVADEAMYMVVTHLFPNASEETQQAFKTLYEKQHDTNQSRVSQAILRRSQNFGKTLAEGLIAWIDGDHFLETRDMTFTMPEGEPSLWTPTAENQTLIEPYWGQIRPFALEYVDECAESLNISYSEDENSAFYAQAMEVMQTGADITYEQRTIAEFWVDTPGQTGTPSGHWLSIENQLVDQLDLTLDQAAQMYAMVGVAMADSFISCWSLKYQTLLLRPETYIRQHIRRGWYPYIATPAFPAYPSGHSVVSAAASEVLTSLFGTVAFTDNTHGERGYAPRTFTSFTAAADEAAISRLYGGIHFRVDIENGLRQGRCVASRVIESIRFRPLGQGE